MPNYVPGIGSHQAKLVIVGEAPGSRENAELIPFVGPTGQILNECLFKAGITRHECYITNVVKFQPPGNDFDKLSHIGVNLEQSIRELWENEINQIKPNAILAVGNEALKACAGKSGILEYRGSILLGNDGKTKVIPTIHPAALFNRAADNSDDSNSRANKSGGLEWTYLKLIEHDINRAVEESNFNQFDLIDRQLTVAHNSLDVFRFFREYENLNLAACDIESINCTPVCVGFAFNRFHAISIPLLRHIGKYPITDMGINELREVWRIVYQKLSTLDLIGHNFKYDEYKLTLAGFGDRKFRTMHLKSDTLLKTRVLFPELPLKKLHVVSSIWTKEPFYKDEGTEFKVGKSKIEQLLLYNAKDCAVEKEVDEEQEKDLISLGEQYNIPLVDYYYNYMMRKHSIYLRMENVGFAVDNERKKELKVEYTELQNNIHKQLIESIGHEVNVKSAPQMFNLLYKEMNFKLIKTAPTSEDAIVRLIANHANKTKAKYKPILEAILEERRIRDQKSRYINFEPDYDGTCKTVYNISATETCRSSTGILKKPVRPKKIGLAFHTISAHGRLAKAIKSMLRPRKGKVFIKADASQAEARVVAVLAKQWDLLEAFDVIDIHRRTAALVLGLTPDLNLSLTRIPVVDDLGKDSPERFCGKKTRHAGNYKMGKSRFMMEFNTDAQKFEINMNISEWKAGDMIEKFRNADPRLALNFWNDIEECIASTRVLIDPFGGIRVFNSRMDDEIYKEAYANIPQRTVAHLVSHALINISDELGEAHDATGYFIGEKHDELVMEVPENDYSSYAELLRTHMQKPIDFNTYCSIKRDYVLTIPCDVEISDTHYGEFRKFKSLSEVSV